MKIRITSAHCIGNGRDVWPGDVLEVEPAFASREVKKGFAVLAGLDEKVTVSLSAKPVDQAPAQLEPGSAGSSPEPPAPAEAGEGEGGSGEGHPAGARGRRGRS